MSDRQIENVRRVILDGTVVVMIIAFYGGLML